MTPSISVVFPVYNAALFLKEAIDSILLQSFTDFELLIFDDGSTDNSRSIIDSYSDTRIVRRYSDTNQGLISVLNRGLEEAQGKYIARMDADDISLPDRFQKQFEFMELNQDTGICGTQLKLIDSDEMVLRPTDDISLRWWFFKGSPLAHPSVFIRTAILRNHHLRFNQEAYVAEDFDLWWRLAFHCKMANLNEPLLKYRVHSAQESSAKAAKQIESHHSSLLQFLTVLGIDKDIFQPGFIESLLTKSLEPGLDKIQKSLQFFDALMFAENACHFFSKTAIISQRNELLIYQIQTIKKFNLKHLKLLNHPVFNELLLKAGIKRSVYIFKCLIKWKTR